MGANVEEQSINNLVGTGSNWHDLGGSLRKSDIISLGVVGCITSKEEEVRGWCGVSSGDKLSQMVLTFVWKKWVNVEAICWLSVWAGSGDDGRRFRSRFATEKSFLESFRQSSIRSTKYERFALFTSEFTRSRWAQYRSLSVWSRPLALHFLSSCLRILFWVRMSLVYHGQSAWFLTFRDLWGAWASRTLPSSNL